jgi:hypothetical protein
VAAEDHQLDLGRHLPRADPDRVLGQPQHRRLALRLGEGLVTLTLGLLLLVTMPIMPKPQPMDAPGRPSTSAQRETLQLVSLTPRPCSAYLFHYRDGRQESDTVEIASEGA